jgi:uncharacterized membrane protein
MYTKARIFGFNIHPMLLVFPVALYTGTLLLYTVYILNNNIFWFKVGYVVNLAAIITAVLAAIPGLIDFLNIPSDSNAKRVGFFHMVFNLIALLLYSISFLFQKDNWNKPVNIGISIGLSAMGFILTCMAGYIGWSMVQKHHVGVDPIK